MPMKYNVNTAGWAAGSHRGHVVELSLTDRLVVVGLLCVQSPVVLFWFSLVWESSLSSVLIPVPCPEAFTSTATGWSLHHFICCSSVSSGFFAFRFISSMPITKLAFPSPSAHLPECLLFSSINGMNFFSSICKAIIVFLMVASVLILLSALVCVLLCVSSVTVGWPLFSSVATSWESVAGLVGLAFPRRQQQQSILAMGRNMTLYRPRRALSLTKQ